MKNNKIVFFAFVLLVVNLSIASSQTDSLRGYGEFKFGETREEIMEVLRNKAIEFRKEYTKKDIKSIFRFPGVELLIYKDYVTIPLSYKLTKKWDVTFEMNVELSFDSVNDSRFYEAAIEMETFAKSIDVAKSIFSSVLDVFTEKYGYNYQITDYLDTSIMYARTFKPGRSISYEWQKVDGYIDLRLWLEDFYISTKQRSLPPLLIEEHGKGGILEIQIKYWSKNFGKEQLENQSELYNEKARRKEEETKSKF